MPSIRAPFRLSPAILSFSSAARFEKDVQMREMPVTDYHATGRRPRHASVTRRVRHFFHCQDTFDIAARDSPPLLRRAQVSYRRPQDAPFYSPLRRDSLRVSETLLAAALFTISPRHTSFHALLAAQH